MKTIILVAILLVGSLITTQAQHMTKSITIGYIDVKNGEQTNYEGHDNTVDWDFKSNKVIATFKNGEVYDMKLKTKWSVEYTDTNDKLYTAEVWLTDDVYIGIIDGPESIMLIQSNQSFMKFQKGFASGNMSGGYKQ